MISFNEKSEDTTINLSTEQREIILRLNQLKKKKISCCKGKWYVRRFDPDTVQNGRIYSSVKEEEVFVYWVNLDIFCGLG